MDNSNFVLANYDQFGTPTSGPTPIYDGTPLSNVWVDNGTTATMDSQSSNSSVAERWQYDAAGTSRPSRSAAPRRRRPLITTSGPRPPGDDRGSDSDGRYQRRHRQLHLVRRSRDLGRDLRRLERHRLGGHRQLVDGRHLDQLSSGSTGIEQWAAPSPPSLTIFTTNRRCRPPTTTSSSRPSGRRRQRPPDGMDASNYVTVLYTSSTC